MHAHVVHLVREGSSGQRLRPAAGWTCRKAACVTTSLFCKEARQAARMATSRESSNRFATLDAALAACSKQAGVAMTSGVSC